MLRHEGRRWSINETADLYEVGRWGKGYFSIGEAGTLLVHPNRDLARSIDLKQLVDRLQLRGLSLPILIRFNDILKDRLECIDSAFRTAIEDHEYRGRYRCVYPIKVNQQRQVVEQVFEKGRPLGFGLEAGSKPELLAVVASSGNDTPIVCNGFKDAEFIEMAMLAQKIGRRVIVVIEKLTELDRILELAQRVGVRPQLGMRVKLSARGSGRWQSSGGYRSKFGLTVTELLQARQLLETREMEDCFRLLHFHLGSQITNIRHVKAALIEASRIYVELYDRGAGLEYLDVGGGLGVDYDGSQTSFESSVNYTLQEYANDVVYHIQTICDERGVPHPTIISESGRAVAAYHSLLVFDVLGATSYKVSSQLLTVPDDAEQPLRTLQDTHQNLSVRNLVESFHDAQQALEMAFDAFSAGYMPLDQRSVAENLFWEICRRIRDLARDLEELPEELAGIDGLLAETYFCNFSLFQSIPDAWAIKQLFPVMPIHRLDQQPTVQATLGDITCDSDGKMNCFIDRRDMRHTLPLHRLEGRSYYIGAFLLGAYQEILGDLHNLFGDTNAVHVSLTAEGDVALDTIIKGDTVSDVLHYVQFTADEVLEKLQSSVEAAVHENRIDHHEAGYILKFYEDGLNGYTYLEDPELS